MTESMTRATRIVSLAPTGVHLIAAAGDPPVLRLSDGRMLALDDPPTDLLDAASGTSANPKTTAYLDRLLAEVAERREDLALRRWPTAHREVCLLGDAPVLDDLALALESWGGRVRRADALDARDRPGALVVAASDDAAGRDGWRVLDALPAAGIAWLRVYREGECVWIDPLAVDEHDATSAQVVRRRIAASTAPAALEAWLHHAPAAEAPWDAASRAIVVGRLVQMIAAWARGGEALEELRTRLWKLVPATGAVSEHTVLAYPETAPRVSR